MRHLEIATGRFVEEKVPDFARLLIRTLDLRKAERMQRLMREHETRMEIAQKFFREWRLLVN
jgi:hypothetical protein